MVHAQESAAGARRAAFVVALLCLAAWQAAPCRAQQRTVAPFPCVKAKAFHIMPETTNQESGYFSLCEGLDGRIYVGTAKYGVNAYLVEFDPVRGTQRIVVDTNKVCGLNATGYAAQAKIHTRNFVGPSGTIYVGSKQGYKLDASDTSDYPGGYVMSYDPRTGGARRLGMPYKGQGVIDVVADEARGLLYVVTCEDQHWMVGDLKGGQYREIGPMLTPYATTLVDAHGRANALTAEFRLAQYDPATGKVAERPIEVDGRPFTRADGAAIPTWVLAADGRTAWLILMNDPTLLAIDLDGAGQAVKAASCGRMVDGPNPDSRCALTVAPDGRLYALVRVRNDTGFGTGMLHWLARYDPAARKMEQLGVLAVENPDFFDFDAARKAGKNWIHGYHTLPDGTLTPLHNHMALLAAHDGTLYATVIYPFTLLRIDQFRHVDEALERSPAAAYIDAEIGWLDRVQADLPEITRTAELLADRHLKGGAVGGWYQNQTLGPELMGRAGNIMHITLDLAGERTEEARKNDAVLVGFDAAPDPGDVKRMRDAKARGCYVVGFGPKAHPKVAPAAAECDVFFDTGFGADDSVVALPDGTRAGRANHVVNAMHGWVLMAEMLGAFTRRGVMPTMWKSYSYPDGREWADRYYNKKLFHDEYKVPPQPPGMLGTAYIVNARGLLERLRIRQTANLRRAAELVTDELKAGRKTVVAWTGHMGAGYIGRGEDAVWSRPIELHLFVPEQREEFRANTPDGAFVLYLACHGLDPTGPPIFAEKHQRLILMATENPDPAFQGDGGALLRVDLGWAFGDGCVALEGYPFAVFAPSGLLQAAAYGAVNAEVMARRAGR